MRLNCNNQKLRRSSQRKSLPKKKKVACAVNAAESAFLPSGDFSEVADKIRL